MLGFYLRRVLEWKIRTVCFPLPVSLVYSQFFKSCPAASRVRTLGLWVVDQHGLAPLFCEPGHMCAEAVCGSEAAIFGRVASATLRQPGTKLFTTDEGQWETLVGLCTPLNTNATE